LSIFIRLALSAIVFANGSLGSGHLLAAFAEDVSLGFDPSSSTFIGSDGAGGIAVFHGFSLMQSNFTAVFFADIA
jgi:hypothetical protein